MPRTFVRTIKRRFDVILTCMAAVLLHVEYFLSTPYNIRAYDLSGHVQYLTHVFEKWTVPASTMGWEMHQPPLYYFLGAAWLHLEKLAGVASGDAWRYMQLLSLILSVGTIVAVAVTALLLFERTQDQNKAILFIGIVAALPGIVFMSARISNDVLSTPLNFAMVAALLAWWKTDDDAAWYLCVGIAILALLTKLTAMPLVAALLLCLYFRPGTKPKRKKVLAITAIAMILAATGWLFLLRYSDGLIVKLLTPGIPGMNAKMGIAHRLGDFFTFSPVRILQTTYNDSWTDEYGRPFFWEFLFKSAYFGEWRFSTALQWIHRGMLVGGLFIVFLSAVGLWRDLKKKGAFRIPLLTVFLCGSLFILIGRVMHSIGGIQELRFGSYIMIPVAAFAAMGIDALPKKWRTAAYVALVAYFTCVIAFLLSLAFSA